MRNARIQAVIPALAMNVAVLLAGIVWLSGEYDDKKNAAQASLSAVARATASNLGRSFDHAAQVLKNADTTAGKTAAPLDNVLFIDSLLHQNMQGHSDSIDVSDRDYAHILDEIAPGALYPGLPLINPTTHAPQWPLALKTSKRPDTVSGLVRMLGTDDIQRPLEAGRYKPDGVAMLLRDDGIIIATAPWQADLLGRDVTTLFPTLTAPTGPERIVEAQLNGISYLFTSAHLAGVPLRAVTGVPLRSFFADFQREAVILSALLALMIGTSVYSAWRQWRTLEQMHSFNTSLTQEVRNQSAVLESEIKERQEHEKLARMLRNALEYSGTMVLITDAEGIIEYANPAFFKATGYPPPDIIGKRPSMLRHPDLSPPIESLWPTILAGQSWSGMFCNRRHDGSPLWVSATISPVTDLAGLTTHFVAVEEDATSRRDGEEELREAKRVAEAASLAKSEFLSSMSHELRTPMNAILGFAQLLVDSEAGALGERQRFYADSILKSGHHLLSLVNDILDMARIEAGRLSLSFEHVVIDQVMAEVLPMIQSLAERRKVNLINDITGKAAPVLEADFTRLKQVLINLSTNAVKYNRTGGTVRFSLSYGETGPVRIAVSDTGIGIPEKRRAEVFQPFARLGAEASSVEGTGIGLTISKMLVEAMGGQIDFFTQENLGTTFWLEVPRATRQPTPAAAPPNESRAAAIPQGKAGCCHTLLYVEDNPSNVELMQEVIAQDPDCHCRLLTAGTAEEGITLARQHQPDLVIMDINLPGLSGIDAVARMKADPELHAIPVIALSADVMPDTIRNGMKAGFLRYLRKPLDIAEFRKILYQLDSNAS